MHCCSELNAVIICCKGVAFVRRIPCKQRVSTSPKPYTVTTQTKTNNNKTATYSHFACVCGDQLQQPLVQPACAQRAQHTYQCLQLTQISILQTHIHTDRHMRISEKRQAHNDREMRIVRTNTKKATKQLHNNNKIIAAQIGTSRYRRETVRLPLGNPLA